jgi:hypothetical protein
MRLVIIAAMGAVHEEAPHAAGAEITRAGGIGHAQGADLHEAEAEGLRPNGQQHIERIGDAVVHEGRAAGDRKRSPPLCGAAGLARPIAG